MLSMNKLGFGTQVVLKKIFDLSIMGVSVRVCGSYSDMNAGTPAEALVDFTGGVHICISLSKPPPDLWELMLRASQSKSLMGCGTPQGVRSI